MWQDLLRRTEGCSASPVCDLHFLQQKRTLLAPLVTNQTFVQLLYLLTFHSLWITTDSWLPPFCRLLYCSCKHFGVTYMYVVFRSVFLMATLILLIFSKALCVVFTGSLVSLWRIFEPHLPVHSALRNHVVLYCNFITSACLPAAF